MKGSNIDLMFTVKPLLTPTHQGGAIFKGGGWIETGGLFNLVKIVVSALPKELEIKVEKLKYIRRWRSRSRGSKTNPNFQHVNKLVQMKFYSRDWFIESIIY